MRAFSLLTASVMLAFFVIAVSPTGRANAGSPDLCFGYSPTLTGSGTIKGTGGADVILGSSGNDVTTCGGGEDTIHGNSGNDTLSTSDDSGSLGDDLFHGGSGADTGSHYEGTNALYRGRRELQPWRYGFRLRWR